MNPLNINIHLLPVPLIFRTIEISVSLFRYDYFAYPT